MILSIDLDSEVPIYQQLRDRVVEAIASGELREGSTLPATRQLGADLGINFHTVNKAYDLLRREGLLRLNRKTGAVIQRDPRSGPPGTAFLPDWEARLGTLLAEAVAHGVTAEEVVGLCRDRLTTFQGTEQGEKP
ncbi:GntR family transcriptional regulator [Actinorugispora endophytica]|uniref:DNA-binding transcriptional regulator YhcF (GntR family) n=1 Tax=Actinorugispora endophytica TaxID=1605990 RepID=A0A4V3D961_9ACTN|nr:GntR family transcriptional regulator [Actinorugispora endophytica]TDQ54810.1 DNA-binding transcriptional regulator YhcF (GntR family) [Actinorugispora endophytica]